MTPHESSTRRRIFRSVLSIQAILTLFISATAFAQGGGGGGAKGGTAGALEFFASSAYVGLNKSASAFDLSPGAYFQPLASMSWLQVGGEITYQKLSHQGGTTKSMVILAGLNFNVSGANNSDAVFISLGLANRSGSSDVVDGSSDNPNGLGFHFIAGKRFSLGGRFSYRPSIGVVATGTTGMVFRPLAISMFF